MSLKKTVALILSVFALSGYSNDNARDTGLTLFDFVKSPNIKGWASQSWVKGKPNAPRVGFDKQRGLYLTFPQENVTDSSYSAPNLYYQWKQPRDWSAYNFLAVDIYNPSGESDRMEIDLSTDNGKARVSHHKIFVPARQQIQLRIPLSVYQSWKASPANLEKVKKITLIRRAPPRELNFYIRSIKLLKLETPERQYQFEGLKAWQFGGKNRIVKEGFEMITPDSPFWSPGSYTAVDAPSPDNADCLWNSMITGRTAAEISLPVAEDGEYLVFALMQGRSAFRYDTLIRVGDVREYRHLIANAYPEYRLFRTTAKDRRIKVSLRPGSPGFPWSITALAAMPAERADMLMEKFVWPAYDDMVVAPWSLRAFLREKEPQATAPFTAWDFYNLTYQDVPRLEQPAFSYLPPANGALTISCPQGYRVKRALDYTRGTYDGYVRQPRFFGTVTDEFSVRKGMREHFLLVPPADAPGGELRGELKIAGPDEQNFTIPFVLDNSRLPEDAVDINYFLYYYQFGFSGGAESAKAQHLQEDDELAFMRSCGFKSLETPMMAGITEKDGKLVYNFAPMIGFMKKYHRAGFDTTIPMPLYLYQQIRRINRHIGGKDYLYSGKELERSLEELQDFVRQADEALKKESFCPPAAWYPFDEFGNYPYISRMHRAIRKAGGLTYSTSVGRYGNGYNISADDGLSIYCFPGMAGADIPKLRRDIEKIGSRFWRYTIEYSDPLLERYAWGLSSWNMGVTGHGAWHYGPHSLSLSELQTGSYYYAYGTYGAGEVMPTLSLLGVMDAMQDYAALSILDKSGRERELLDSLRRDVVKLGSRPSEQELRQWFDNGGREKLAKIRRAALQP